MWPRLASANVEADEDGWTSDIRDFQKAGSLICLPILGDKIGAHASDASGCVASGFQACIDMSDAVGANDWPQVGVLV